MTASPGTPEPARAVMPLSRSCSTEGCGQPATAYWHDAGPFGAGTFYGCESHAPADARSVHTFAPGISEQEAGCPGSGIGPSPSVMVVSRDPSRPTEGDLTLAIPAAHVEVSAAYEALTWKDETDADTQSVRPERKRALMRPRSRGGAADVDVPHLQGRPRAAGVAGLLGRRGPESEVVQPPSVARDASNTRDAPPPAARRESP